MSEFSSGSFPSPEEVREAQLALAAQAESNISSGELDGLEEWRAEVASDPVATAGYLQARKRNSEATE